MAEPGTHTSRIWVMGWGVPTGYGGYPPSSGGLSGSSGRSRSARTPVSQKGVGALRCALRKPYVKDLRDVFRLTDRKPVPVNLRLRPMHTPSMRRRQSRSKFYSTVWEGDPPYQTLLARIPSARAPQSHCLLRHPRLECARLTYHDLGLYDICYQYVPA